MLFDFSYTLNITPYSAEEERRPFIVVTEKTVIVNDIMQRNYRYTLSESEGSNFDSEFKPELTPWKMLEMGIFGGKYMTDCTNEFPASWFKNAGPTPLGL